MLRLFFRKIVFKFHVKLIKHLKQRSNGCQIRYDNLTFNNISNNIKNFRTLGYLWLFESIAIRINHSYKLWNSWHANNNWNIAIFRQIQNQWLPFYCWSTFNKRQSLARINHRYAQKKFHFTGSNAIIFWFQYQLRVLA